MTTTTAQTAPEPADVSAGNGPAPARAVPAGLSLRQTFSALRHRNFRLFFFGQLISLIGTWMQNTAQGWLVYQLTGSKLLLGVVAAAGTLPMLLLSMWGGSLADRFPKRSILVPTQTGMMLLAFVFTALVATHTVLPWHIVVLAALSGVAMAFDMPARQAFMVEMTSREDLMNAISLNSSIFNGARVIGPAVAGIVIAKAGMSWCFFLNGVSFLAVILGLLAMRLPPHTVPHHEGPMWQHVRDGLRHVWGNAEVSTMLGLFAVVGVFGWSFQVLMPAFARDVLHVSADGYANLLSVTGAGAFVGALIVAAMGHIWRRRAILLGGLGFFSAMLLWLSLTHDYHVALFCLAMSGLGMTVFFSTINTMVQTSVPDALRGRVMGVWALLFGGMMPIGAMEAGSVAHYFGVSLTIGSGAIVCGLAALVVWIVLSRRKVSA